MFKNVIVVSNPRYYYIKNKMKNNVINQKAKQQWTHLIQLISQYNNNIYKLESNRDVKLQVFIEKYILIINNILFIPFKNLPYYQLFVHFFKKNGYRIIKLPYIFNGSRNMKYSHNKNYLWCGYNDIQSLETIQSIYKHINHSISPIFICLNLINNNYKQLAKCFCPLDSEHCLVYKEAFSNQSYQFLLDKYGKEGIINITNKDASDFVTDSIYIGNNNSTNNIVGYLILYKCSSQLKQKLLSIGIIVINCNISEFILSGISIGGLIYKI